MLLICGQNTVNMNKIQSICTIIFLLCAVNIFSQAQTRLKWIVPLNATKMPAGKPSVHFAHYVEKETLYRIDANGNSQQLPYDSISYSGGAYWEIWKNRLKGIYHDSLGEIIPPVYQFISPLTVQKTCWAFMVTKYGMSAIINEKNKILLPWSSRGYKEAVLYGDTLLEYFNKNEKSYISINGVAVKESVARLSGVPEFKRITSDKYIFTYIKNKKVVSDTFAGAEPFVQSFAAVRRDSLWGYIDVNGSWKIKPLFQVAKSFDEYGHAVVKSKGKYGVIRKDGSFAVPAQYTFLKPFSANLFEIKVGDLIGLVDSTGKQILEPGPYFGFVQAGTNSFGARLTDKVLLYNDTGEKIPLDSITECTEQKTGFSFLIKKQPLKTSVSKYKLTGLADQEGNILIPAVFKGNVQVFRHFVVADNSIEKESPLVTQLVSTGDNGRYILYNRYGKLLLNFAIGNYPRMNESYILVFEMVKKFGLVSPEGMILDPDYSQIEKFNDRWFYIKKGNDWGILLIE